MDKRGGSGRAFWPSNRLILRQPSHSTLELDIATWIESCCTRPWLSFALTSQFDLLRRASSCCSGASAALNTPVLKRGPSQLHLPLLNFSCLASCTSTRKRSKQSAAVDETSSFDSRKGWVSPRDGTSAMLASVGTRANHRQLFTSTSVCRCSFLCSDTYFLRPCTSHVVCFHAEDPKQLTHPFFSQLGCTSLVAHAARSGCGRPERKIRMADRWPNGSPSSRWECCCAGGNGFERNAPVESSGLSASTSGVYTLPVNVVTHWWGAKRLLADDLHPWSH